jgi:hypothetical protein
MRRTRRSQIQNVPRIPASVASLSPGLLSPGGDGSALGKWKAWSHPYANSILNSGYKPSTRYIHYNRVSCYRPIRGITKIDHFLTTNGVAPVNSFMCVWLASSRALVRSVGMDAAWTLHTNSWQTATVPAFDFTEDIFIGWFGTSAGMPAFAGLGSVTVDNYLNFDGANDHSGVCGAPGYDAPPDPLPAPTAREYRTAFLGLR